jgi:NitT/TauT family transport system permease protein
VTPTAAAESRRRPLDERTWVVRAAQVLILLVGLGVWELAARQGWIDEFFWSKPSSVVNKFGDYLDNGRLLHDTAFTVRSAMVGFVAGTLIGAVIGLSLWWSRFAARVVEPFIVAFHAIPKLALAPLFVLVFGLGLSSKIAVVVALTVVTSALSAHAGVKAVDADLLTLMWSLGASRAQVFRKVVVPAAAPWIIAALRINIGLSLTGAIVAEMVASQRGLGRLIVYAGSIYDVSLIWVGAFTLAFVAIAMYALVGFLERALLRGVLHGAEPVARLR